MSVLAKWSKNLIANLSENGNERRLCLYQLSSVKTVL